MPEWAVWLATIAGLFAAVVALVPPVQRLIVRLWRWSVRLTRTRRRRIRETQRLQDEYGSTVEDLFVCNEQRGALPPELDGLLLYQPGLRPRMPITDCLYLEYIRLQLKNTKIDRVFIAPWSSREFDGRSESFEIYKGRVAAWFRGYESKVEILDLASHPTVKLNPELFSSVDELTERYEIKKYVSFLKITSRLRLGKITVADDSGTGDKWSMWNPLYLIAGNVARKVVHGLLETRLFVSQLVNHEIVKRKDASRVLQVTTLAWVGEPAKLALGQQLAREVAGVEYKLVAGVTVRYGRVRREPLPVTGSPLEVFPDSGSAEGSRPIAYSQAVCASWLLDLVIRSRWWGAVEPDRSSRWKNDKNPERSLLEMTTFVQNQLAGHDGID